MAGPSNEPLPFCDLALSRRLERAEAACNARFVEARARLSPERGACWIEVAGAYALYDTPTSPSTQTFGLGLFETATRADMDRLEDFFQRRGAPVYHEISPLMEGGLLTLLNERGYQPIEFTSVMFRQIRRDVRLAASLNERIQVRLACENEQDLWGQTAARGWSELAEHAEFLREIGAVTFQTESALSFLAESDGKPMATGVLYVQEGVALLAGASTVPEGRKRGAQLALLEARLRYAAERGCDLAMMGAAPGSSSQRNAERHGFRIAYTRIKWRLARPAG